MPQLANRISYETYLPLTEQTPETPSISTAEKHKAAIEMRAQHLCSIGFLLRHFNPQNLTISDEQSISFNGLGGLIEDLSQGFFHDADELAGLLDDATTFGEPTEEVQ